MAKELNPFASLISPVTGRRWLEKGHVFLGNADNIEETYPLFEDQLFLRDLRSRLLQIKQDLLWLQEASFILQKDNKYLKGAQALNKLPAGLLSHTNGIVEIKKLGMATFPDPTGLLNNIPIPNPDFNPLNPWDWIMSGAFLGQIFLGSSAPPYTEWETGISSSYALAQTKIAQILKRFDVSGFVVKNKTIHYDWPNPAMALIPEALKSLYGLEDAYTFSNAQALDEIEAGLLKNSQEGVLSHAISGQDYVNTADFPVGKLVILDPLYPGDGHKLIAPTDFSTRGNEPNEFGYLEPDVINILVGIAAKFTKFAVTSLTTDLLIKVGEGGELKSATPDTDYVAPSTFQTLVSTVSVISGLLSALQTAYNLFVLATTAKDIAQDAAIATNTAKDVVQDAQIVTLTAKDVAQDVAITAAQTTATGAVTAATTAGAAAAAAEVTATGAATTAASASAAAAAAGLAITGLQLQILTKASLGDVDSAVSSAIHNLTLNGINITENIDTQGFQIDNLGAPIQPHNAATKGYVDAAVSSVPPALITLTGDVAGVGMSNMPIMTFLTKTLNQIPNAGDVNIAGFRLKNLNKTPEDYDDAISFDFLCNLLQDKVGVQWL